MSGICVLALGTLAFAACGNRGAPAPAAVTEAVEGGTDGAPEDERPPRIYHDLTHYQWYARAEPLVIEQHRYGPRGAPHAIPLAKLRLSGNYQGVDFYVLHGEKEPPTTVYVPVYEGYWLPFIAEQPLGD